MFCFSCFILGGVDMVQYVEIESHDFLCNPLEKYIIYVLNKIRLDQMYREKSVINCLFFIF